jgi:hypothetical protein
VAVFRAEAELSVAVDWTTINFQVRQTSTLNTNYEELAKRLGVNDGNPFRLSIEPLGKLIRRHMLTAATSTKSQFLPLSELEAIVTDSNIRRELQRSGVTSDLDRIADKVWSTKKFAIGTTTRRKIFAILCLIERAQNIQDFIYEDVFDSHLPFGFEHNQNQVLRNNKSLVPIRLFTRWQDTDRDSFAYYQGQFLAPYFKFVTENFPHYPLHHCVVLPFLGREWQDEVLSDVVATYPSVVYRVEIHSAHHDYSSPLVSSDLQAFYCVNCLFSLGKIREAELRHQTASADKGN